MASPPDFDSLFTRQHPPQQQQQQPGMQSHQNSMDYNPSYSSAEFGAIYAQQLGDEPLSDEPQILHHRASGDLPHPHRQASLHSFESRNGVERKDSVPFDPTSSSTLIATAPNDGSRAFDHNSQMHYSYGHDVNGSQYYQSPPLPQHQDYSNNYDNDWSVHDMLAQQNSAEAHEADSRRASWNGSTHLGSTPFDDQIDELQRIISNASSHAGTPGEVSRVASPFIPAADQMMSGHVRHDSQSSIARSPSPFATTPSMAAPSPPIYRPASSSLQGSPSFSKPQSPPALIIPNSSPSPAYQPMQNIQTVPQPTVNPSHGGQFGNSLLPPVNPALEHLTGMAGISPIAPSADGPMIYIQPSTPISGMKEGGGVFDAALRRANAQHQANMMHQQQQSPQPSQNGGTPPITAGSSPAPQDTTSSFVHDAQNWSQNFDMNLAAAQVQRPRAKSESYMTDGGAFERQATMQLMQGPMGQFGVQPMQESALDTSDQWDQINAWRMNQAEQSSPGMQTLDPRTLPGNEGMDMQSQLREIHAQQRQRLQQLNTESTGVFKYEPAQISPTSMAFYSQWGIPPPQQGAYMDSLAPEAPGLGARRRSFAEGTMHHATGAGTPDYGAHFTVPGAPPGRLRGAQFTMGHRRAVKSEDYGRPGSGSGWGMGGGGSTADFLQAITNPSDGTLLPPAMRGRSMSHSRQSSISSGRSASPALSVSSQGSSFSHHSHMDMPDGVPQDLFHQNQVDVAKWKVTTPATEVASRSRRTNSGNFKCPVPGCKSTFTRHFNLKGHMRSHNDERPYRCLYEGCPKSIVGFARQHDCKRHMALHVGLKPFECEGCGKQFARLDALTRHHKSDQGQECAISHPLPTNPDGSPMSEGQYKAYLEARGPPDKGKRRGSGMGYASGQASADVSADER